MFSQHPLWYSLYAYLENVYQSPKASIQNWVKMCASLFNRMFGWRLLKWAENVTWITWQSKFLLPLEAICKRVSFQVGPWAEWSVFSGYENNTSAGGNVRMKGRERERAAQGTARGTAFKGEIQLGKSGCLFLKLLQRQIKALRQRQSYGRRREGVNGELYLKMEIK